MWDGPPIGSTSQAIIWHLYESAQPLIYQPPSALGAPINQHYSNVDITKLSGKRSRSQYHRISMFLFEVVREIRI
jgi:hypothetical protein